MELETLLLFATAAVASLFMAWVVGAGSSGATPFAPAVGANAISTMKAAFLVGILGFAGAVTQDGNVSEAVGTGLVDGVTLPVGAVIVVLLIGAGLMAIGIYTGYSIATLVPSFLIAQAAVVLGVPVSFNEIVVSAIVGSGAAVAGGAGVSPRKLGYTAAAWIGSLVFAFELGYGAMVLVGA